MKLLKEYHEIFQEEAEKARAALEWEEKLNIIAYETDLGGKAAENYRKAVEKTGLEPEFEKTFGGSDNNVFAKHGIEGLVIATLHEPGAQLQRILQHPGNTAGV